MNRLTLTAASMIVDKTLEKGREMGFAPLTVAVLDAGGQLKALKREDDSSLIRPEIAMGKAWGALGMGFGRPGTCPSRGEGAGVLRGSVRHVRGPHGSGYRRSAHSF